MRPPTAGPIERNLSRLKTSGPSFGSSATAGPADTRPTRITIKREWESILPLMALLFQINRSDGLFQKTVADRRALEHPVSTWGGFLRRAGRPVRVDGLGESRTSGVRDACVLVRSGIRWAVEL